MKFYVGDRVIWSSQSKSFWREKTGVVVEVIPPGQRPDPDKFPSLYKGAGCGYGRKRESYVVNAAQEGRVSKYYWPRETILTKISTEPM